MSNNGTLKLSEARLQTPAPTALRVQVLRDAVAEAITIDDITQIIKAQVEKAKAGSIAAAKFVLDLAADTPDRKKNVQAKFSTTPKTVGEIKKACAREIVAAGPQFSEDLADFLGISESDVTEALEACDWFSRNERCWSLTAKGRKEYK